MSFSVVSPSSSVRTAYTSVAGRTDGERRRRAARGRCLDFVTRLGKQQPRRPLSPPASLLLLALWRSRKESYFSLHSSTFSSPQVVDQVQIFIAVVALRCVSVLLTAKLCIPLVKWENVTKVEGGRDGASSSVFVCGFDAALALPPSLSSFLHEKDLPVREGRFGFVAVLYLWRR